MPKKLTIIQKISRSFILTGIFVPLIITQSVFLFYCFSDPLATHEFVSKIINRADYFFSNLRNRGEENKTLPVYKIQLQKEAIELFERIGFEDYAGRKIAAMAYIKGRIEHDNKENKAEIKLRGDNIWHWRYKQKSLMLKLPKDNMDNNNRKINFINSKTKYLIPNFIYYNLAKKMGLMAPESNFLSLFVNNEYFGVYEYQGSLDENYLRKNNKLPSDIYVGETENFGILFGDEKLWEKNSELNTLKEDKKSNLRYLLETINDDANFLKNINKILNIEKILRMYAHAQILGRIRFDNHHNHRFYFDPSSGKFEPIVYDSFGSYNGLDITLYINTIPNRLWGQIFRYPHLVERKNQLIFDYTNGIASTNSLGKNILEATNLILHDLKQDKYRDYVVCNDNAQTGDDCKNIPFSIREFLSGIEDLIEFHKENNDSLLSDLKIGFAQIRYLKDKNIFKILRYGESAIKMSIPEDAIIVRDLNFNGIIDPTEENEIVKTGEILYPGFKKIPIPDNPNLAYPPYTYYYTHLVYPFIIKNKNAGDIVKEIKFTNNILGEEIIPQRIEQANMAEMLSISSEPDLISVHPWTYLKKEIPKTITLAGEQVIKNDLIIEKNDNLIIEPGTTIKMDEGASIISFGKVKMEGSEKKPIKIIPLNETKPWGVFALQGEKSKGSSFSHCEIKGGSVEDFEFVEYSGMFSVYNSEATVENCTFSDNKIGDDTLNAKNSHLIIKKSAFQNALSDAIDFDISTGEISDSNFINSGNDAIDLMTSSILVKNNKMEKCGDKGISVGEDSDPFIVDNIIENSNIGIEIKDNSKPIIYRNLIKNNKKGLNSYMKNWRYEKGGHSTLIESILKGNTEEITLDETSKLDIFNTQTEKNYQDWKNIEILKELPANFQEKIASK